MAEAYSERVVKIKVIGVGGAGNNVINRMIESGVDGVDFTVINTDQQDLNKSICKNKLQIGEKLTNGMGAGSKPEIGKQSAEESRAAISKILEDTDMVFITAGMGGGTGTGAAPIVAKVAREMNILTVGIVTKPFGFEGPRRMRAAMAGINELQGKVDSLVIIPNERLKQVSNAKISLSNAFGIADDVLRRGVQSISGLINVPGFINLDFADVTSVMKNAGYAHMGVGYAAGKDKAEEAAKMAISSPLLETNITGATGVLVSITASEDIQLDEIDAASNMIYEEAHPDANIIWGATFDSSLQDEMRVTIIATGFDAENAKPVAPAKAEPVVAEEPKEEPKKSEVFRATEAPILAGPQILGTMDVSGMVAGGKRHRKRLEKAKVDINKQQNNAQKGGNNQQGDKNNKFNNKQNNQNQQNNQSQNNQNKNQQNNQNKNQQSQNKNQQSQNNNR